MPSKAISDSVRRLIAERIDSIPELEAIMLLREEPTRTWTAEEVGRRLYVSSPVAGHVLETLAKRGFCSGSSAGYRYAPVTPDLTATVDLLSTTYRSDLIAITNMIHAKPNASVRQFADAFRFRKDK